MFGSGSTNWHWVINFVSHGGVIVRYRNAISVVRCRKMWNDGSVSDDRQIEINGVTNDWIYAKPERAAIGARRHAPLSLSLSLSPSSSSFRPMKNKNNKKKMMMMMMMMMMATRDTCGICSTEFRSLFSGWFGCVVLDIFSCVRPCVCVCVCVCVCPIYLFIGYLLTWCFILQRLL